MLSWLLLVGCAIHDVHYGPDALGAPHDVGDGLAEVVIVRPSIVGYAIPERVDLNGKSLPPLWAHRSIHRLVPAGPVEVVAWGEVDCHLTFVAREDTAYVVHSRMVSGWMRPRWQLELAYPEDGAHWAATCPPVRE